MSINRQLQQFQRAYQDDALQTKVLGATPLELIVLLYEGAIEALEKAQRAIADGNIQLKGVMVNKASDIVEGLRTALNFEKGGDIAHQLDALYLFAKHQISQGHAANDVKALAAVIGVLRELLPAWQHIAREDGAGSEQGKAHA
ncbi:flagellar export chaperone FliS [Crenobacter sp. SG2303]|uniref:Flagellar secretion chaperone FliS n=1 Tax=Crenobacter oryzisoli TaxID=3056844 RepID=A0ABT7XPW6_9NEIS|nr:flagellar export chaperone FliS [Crenobacter sp. SG2303]MDN0075838.1 flagellar export chaperone FliS [Crenobacter sp. SG2303]